jgi:ComF family protein
VLSESARSFQVGLGPVDPALRVRAWAAYSGDVPALVLRFKFAGQRRLAVYLAARMAERVEEDLTDFDVLCPVPTHFGRYLQRGFNPGSLLASALAPAGTVPIGRLLRRKPGPAPQSQLSLEERQEAPFGLFAASPARLPQLKGASVLLVDDVCTTGATLAASARALYAGGAQWVEALVFARTLRQEAR